MESVINFFSWLIKFRNIDYLRIWKKEVSPVNFFLPTQKVCLFNWYLLNHLVRRVHGYTMFFIKIITINQSEVDKTLKKIFLLMILNIGLLFKIKFIATK